MGNCLEPSESEIRKAKRAKLRKMAARDPSLAVGAPPNVAYPYPTNPYNDPRLSGVYIPTPIPPQPSAYAVVDARTGQGFIVHDPGPVPTTAIPVSVPYVNGGRRSYRSNNGGKNFSSKNTRESSIKFSDDGDDDSDDHRDGKIMRNSPRHSRQNSIGISVEKISKSSTMKSQAEKAPREMIETVEVHEDKNQKTHQNGFVKTGLFTKSGVMDLDAEPETIIVDFLDPIPTKTATDPIATVIHTTVLPKVEYESANDFTETEVNEHSTNDYVFEAIVEPEPRLPSQRQRSGNEYELPVFVSGSSTKSEKHEINMETLDSPVHDSKFSPTEGAVDIFPPKIFENEKQSSSIPDILKRTLSQTSSNSLPSDSVEVVITYSVLGEYELDIVRRLTRQLELVGLSVWAERLGDSSRARKSDKTAQAILGAKVLIVMLSEGSCEQRFIRDHVAIATMTNISIFPVASDSPQDVNDAMPQELKLQLTPYAWTELVGGSEDRSLFQLRSLARSVQDEVEERSSLTSNGMTKRGNLIQRQKSLTNHGMTGSSFWDVHFGHRDRVKWDRLEHTLKDAFKMTINDTIPEDIQTIVFTSIKNRTTSKGADVFRNNFVDVCQTDVWEAIVQMAGMIQAVRDVFEIKSTVRHLVVEYIEHFNNTSVVKALRDLLSDPDPNFRSVAVVSLARCMAVSPAESENLVYVEQTLEDDDRLVREAGCLALGHLRAESAVQKLIHVWRNDVISQVREAAKMALNQIGGEEVTGAMMVTDVLANEIRELTDESKNVS